jgi:cytochrome d ubiquinol oxidase subunit II
MDIAWYALLGLFTVAYLVLGGYDYGVGILLTTTGSPDERRLALTAVGPFFLGNEVWLVAAVGILFGAFPRLEGELLSGLYPAVALALAGVILVTAAVQLRSRPTAERARARWDRLIIIGSGLASLGWGCVLAGLLQGVPLRADGHVDGVTHVLTPFVAAGGLTLVALMAVHGAAFLALRLPAGPADRAARLGRRLVPVALAAVGVTTGMGLLSAQVRHVVRQPAAAVPLVVLIVAALVGARWAFGRRRPGVAFAGTALALALPVLLVAAGTWPYALVSSTDPGASLTVAAAAASGPTLQLLSWLTIPLLPVLLGAQLMCWWVFRGRVGPQAPVYW